MSDQRINTTADTEKKVLSLQTDLGFTSKAAVLRAAIAISLKEDINSLEKYSEEIKLTKGGGEYHYTALFKSDVSDLYAIIINQSLGRSLGEEEFISVIKAHIMNGINLLYIFKQNRKKTDPTLHEYLLQQIKEKNDLSR